MGAPLSPLEGNPEQGLEYRKQGGTGRAPQQPQSSLHRSQHHQGHGEADEQLSSAAEDVVNRHDACLHLERNGCRGSVRILHWANMCAATSRLSIDSHVAQT